MFGWAGHVCLALTRLISCIVGIGLFGSNEAVGMVAQHSLASLTARLVDLILFWNVRAGTVP